MSQKNKWEKVKEKDKDSQDNEPAVSLDLDSKKSHENQAQEQEPNQETNQETRILKQEIRSLNQQLDLQQEKVNQVVKETEKRIASLHADMSNTRKRLERDVENAHKYANKKLVEALLPVLDGMRHALDVDKEKATAESLLEGIALTSDLLESTLVKFNLEVIDPNQGDDFNPDQHEAMSMQDQPSQKSNTIIQVVQKGYALNGRVIRAAMVIIAK